MRDLLEMRKMASMILRTRLADVMRSHGTPRATCLSILTGHLSKKEAKQSKVKEVKDNFIFYRVHR
jgi:hypothetical protein